jgi:hypothetical protein
MMNVSRKYRMNEEYRRRLANSGIRTPRVRNIREMP